MRRVTLAFAAMVEGGGGALRDPLVDANRLRRMDRFGRSGVLAGARALSAAGVAAAVPGAAPDPRFGIVVGTAYGCRDAITQHERLLAAAARVEDLAPSVFAATVHNTVAGELAIGWGLGGPAETLVSGRTAGLEALVLAASRIAKGDADRILVVAAEGIDDAMREADATLVESSAAVLLEAEEEGEISLSKRGRAAFVEAALSFDPDGTPGEVRRETGRFLRRCWSGWRTGRRRCGDRTPRYDGPVGNCARPCRAPFTF